MTTENLINLCREYRELQAMIKSLDGEAETLKQKLISFMDEEQVDKYQAGEYEVRYTVYESARLDTSALKKEMPDIVERFTKATTATRFQVA